MQFVVWPQVESLDPCQKIIAAQLLPTLQVSIADAAIVGVNQVETAVATAVTVKDSFHRLYDVTELNIAKVKNESPLQISLPYKLRFYNVNYRKTLPPQQKGDIALQRENHGVGPCGFFIYLFQGILPP